MIPRAWQQHQVLLSISCAVLTDILIMALGGLNGVYHPSVQVASDRVLF